MTPKIKKIYGGLRSAYKSDINNGPFPSSLRDRAPSCQCRVPHVPMFRSCRFYEGQKETLIRVDPVG